MENEHTDPNQQKSKSDGIDQWNDRLDENLENEDTGNTDADEKASDYSREHGSGDQSDESSG